MFSAASVLMTLPYKFVEAELHALHVVPKILASGNRDNRWALKSALFSQTGKGSVCLHVFPTHPEYPVPTGNQTELRTTAPTQILHPNSSSTSKWHFHPTRKASLRLRLRPSTRTKGRVFASSGRWRLSTPENKDRRWTPASYWENWEHGVPDRGYTIMFLWLVVYLLIINNQSENQVCAVWQPIGGRPLSGRSVWSCRCRRSCLRYSRLKRGSPISYHGNMPGIKLERGQRLHPFASLSLKAPSLAYTVL